jgi:hypothetical protein
MKQLKRSYRKPSKSGDGEWGGGGGEGGVPVMLELTCSKAVGETERHTQQFKVLVLLLRFAYGSVTPNKRHFLSHRINSIKIYRQRCRCYS